MGQKPTGELVLWDEAGLGYVSSYSYVRFSYLSSTRIATYQSRAFIFLEWANIGCSQG